MLPDLKKQNSVRPYIRSESNIFFNKRNDEKILCPIDASMKRKIIEFISYYLMKLFSNQMM